jgi:hypothetical protein
VEVVVATSSSSGSSSSNSYSGRLESNTAYNLLLYSLEPRCREELMK